MALSSKKLEVKKGNETHTLALYTSTTDTKANKQMKVKTGGETLYVGMVEASDYRASAVNVKAGTATYSLAVVAENAVIRT